MENNMQKALTEACREFRLPRAKELPNMGLYLEQVTKYINQCLEPLGCIEVTGSMIRNYVKMGLVQNPVKKQYYATHIQHLIPIIILKSVLSMEDIGKMFARQITVYSDEVAYDYFCNDLENKLSHRFGLKEEADRLGHTQTNEKVMLECAIEAVTHIIYLNACFRWMDENAACTPPQSNGKKNPRS